MLSRRSPSTTTLAAAWPNAKQSCSSCLAERAAHQVDIGRAPARRHQGTPGVRSAPGAGKLGRCRPHSHQWPGGGSVVMTLLSEIGPDLIDSPASSTSAPGWGCVPAPRSAAARCWQQRTKRSANRARQALKLAAQTLSHSDSALGAFYRRLCGRMDKPRANTAIGPQAGAHGVLHAHPRPGVCGPRPTALRRAAAPAQHRRAQAPRCRPRLPDQSREHRCMKSAVLSSVSREHPAPGGARRSDQKHICLPTNQRLGSLVSQERP